MNPILPIVGYAFILGATSGLSPGPLLTLVITESFRSGIRSGVAVAVAPLITDAPIVLLMTILANAVSRMEYVTGGLYILGAAYLVWLALEVFRFKGMAVESDSNVRASFIKGTVANLLNPAPYVFWLTIGAQLLLEAKRISWMAVPLFIMVFYGMLVGLKLLMAVLIGKNRHLLKGGAYRAVLRLMGIFLVFFSAVFAKNGIEKLL
jgi:threonine/homoserine/homoserine lactone efflux protein